MCKKEETQDVTPVIKEAPLDESQVTPTGFALGQYLMSGTVPPSMGASGELIENIAQAQYSAYMVAGLQILAQYARTVIEAAEKQQKELEENQSLNPEVVRDNFVAFLDNTHAQVLNAIEELFDEKTPPSGVQK